MGHLYDVIIVGSGAAGAWAGHQLDTKNVLMLDVGFTPIKKFSDNFLEFPHLKQSSPQGHSILIGEQYESLSNIFGDYLSPKLKSPFMRYVTKTPKQTHLIQNGFCAQQSFSLGGLGNAWGAGCYRYQNYEMVDFPFDASALTSYYDTLTKKIGISGQDDDLVSFLGTSTDLLPPTKHSNLIKRIYSLYNKRKLQFSSQNIFIGYNRLAYKNNEALGLDFYLSHNPSIYTPAFTVNELIDQKKINYLSGRLVETFKESSEFIEINCLNLNTSTREIFKAKNLILAMGALNSAKCVLQSRNDTITKLPILDNRITYTPFLNLSTLGQTWMKENLVGAPLTLVNIRDNQLPLHGTIYSIGNVLISDLLPSLPISAQNLIEAGRLTLPSLAVAQIFYPDLIKKENFAQLSESLELKISYSNLELAGQLEKTLIKIMIRNGFLSHPRLIQYPALGNSFHYAGLLPMKKRPSSIYECNENGKLEGTNRVFIADAANFPMLPAKNHTFTIMANSMRIADWIQRNRLETM